MFIKPSNAGSSRGVSRADDRKSLENGLKEAALHDRRILVEEMIVGHEVECAVFGGGKEEVRASGVGEILAAADFYDFDAKYYNSDSRTVVDPELPGNAAEEIRESAVRIFKAVDGYGLSRVDFFVKEDGEVVFNEINTMPGFTAISMYPMLWEPEAWEKRSWWTIFWNMRSSATKGRRLLWIRMHLGIFDSGVGGLTVAREIMRQIPKGTESSILVIRQSTIRQQIQGNHHSFFKADHPSFYSQKVLRRSLSPVILPVHWHWKPYNRNLTSRFWVWSKQERRKRRKSRKMEKSV